MAQANTLFTTAEAADLAETSPRAVEKAIEEGIVEVRRAPASKASGRRRRLLSAESIYYMAFLKKCDLQLSKKHKHHLWGWFKQTPSSRLLTARCRLLPGVDIKPGEVLRPIRNRVTWYAGARRRWIEINPKVKGGTPVIKGTRVSVYSVAGRLDHGESVDDIVKDNPDLPRDAIEAAAAYARANPLVGRPGARLWRTQAR